MNPILHKIFKFEIFTRPNTKFRRGVAPVIATLLLVAIATVGSSFVFVYAQDSFNSTQISTAQNIEKIRIAGYDSRDVEKINLHDGSEILAKNCCGIADGIKNVGERIAIYLQNDSFQPITISELRFSGNTYTFAPTEKIGEWNKIGNGHNPNRGEYIIVNRHLEGKNYVTVSDSSATIQSGEMVTIILSLDEKNRMHKDYQIKITTNGGNTFVSSLQFGQSSE